MLLSWMREFAPDLTDDVEVLTAALDDLGTPVEERVRLGEGLDGIVVARVLETKPHPDADRVQLVDVDSGDGGALQIVCGAFNMTAGDLIPLATLGTTMPNGMAIERRKMRGEWSNGMLCSATEIGLGEDRDGILILPPGLTPGQPLTEALGLQGDWLLDLEVNANRPDALSMAGVARDLAARLGVGFTLPTWTAPTGGAPGADVASVEIVDADACARFLARVLRDVTIGPSPTWLANRITQAGMRSISNVVDISNYVMLELGHPNHAYDLDQVAGGRLRVRFAQEGERLVTLDDVERSFLAADVLICDGEDTPIGVAGVMGGASTEISDATANVLLEAAWWHPMQIARTSTRLNLRSEASRRFERGTDIWGLDLAVERFCTLLAESGAVTAPDTIDERGQVPEHPPIRVRTDRVNLITGLDLDASTIRGLLEPIGFTVGGQTDGAQVVDAPSFRPDVVEEIDVIEEVARHHGYANLPQTVPLSPHTGRLTEGQKERRRIRATLVGLGLDEALPMPFLAPEDLARTGLDPVGIIVTNPLDARESVVRPSLRPGLLKAVAYNASHRNDGAGLFELGKVFLPPPEGQERPAEPEMLGVVLAGREAPQAVAVWTAVVEALAVDGLGLRAEAVPGLHPTRSAVIVAGDIGFGAVGEIDPAVAEGLGIAERVAWLEVDLDALAAVPRRDRLYRTVSRFPSNDIDLAFVVDERVPASAIEATIRESAGDLLARLRLFDVFRGEAVGEGKRSLAYALRLQAADRTLKDGEVAEIRQRVIDAVESTHGASLRG
ncbi:MAG TPA: phenylalanine--tRNA ligase subunit beta [Acidimicrobiales bacterium]